MTARRELEPVWGCAILAPDTVHRAREASRRLTTLLGREFAGLGDFLVALAEFDREQLWKSLGHPSLFAYLHGYLKLSLGAASLRQAAARLIQRVPEVGPAMREGKLCISAIAEVARVVTPENQADLMPRFFRLSRREAQALVASIKPEAVPRREVVNRRPGTTPEVPVELPLDPPLAAPLAELCLLHSDEVAQGAPPPEPAAAALAAPLVPPGTVPLPTSPPLPTSIRHLTETECRLHLTVSTTFLVKVDRARMAESHGRPGASRADIIEAAIDLLLATQDRRRGLVARPRATARPSGPDHVPASVRRAVWQRDQGRCQWPLDGGGTCGSRLRVQLDHVVPRAKGGPSTVANCRLLCRSHNDLAARQEFGDEWMDRHTGRAEARPLER